MFVNVQLFIENYCVDISKWIQLEEHHNDFLIFECVDWQWMDTIYSVYSISMYRESRLVNTNWIGMNVSNNSLFNVSLSLRFINELEII